MDKIINRVSISIVDNLLSNRYIENEKRDVYIYSATVFFQSTINIIITLFIGLLFDMFFENLCFFIVFKLLRKYSGGLHSSKYITCLSISVFINVLLMFLFVYNKNELVSTSLLIFELLSLLIVLIFSPIINPNKKISTKEKGIYKIIAISESVVLFFISIFLIKVNSIYVFSICYAMVLNSILILTEILINHLKHK